MRQVEAEGESAVRTRRRVLQGGALAGVVALAGCLDMEDRDVAELVALVDHQFVFSSIAEQVEFEAVIKNTAAERLDEVKVTLEVSTEDPPAVTAELVYKSVANGSQAFQRSRPLDITPEEVTDYSVRVKVETEDGDANNPAELAFDGEEFRDRVV